MSGKNLPEFDSHTFFRKLPFDILNSIRSHDSSVLDLVIIFLDDDSYDFIQLSKEKYVYQSLLSDSFPSIFMERIDKVSDYMLSEEFIAPFL